MEKVLNMTFASSLTDLCEVNSSFDTGILRICYTGKNRNKSSFSKETILKCLPTIYNCPIVCNYDRDTDSLGGHDMEIVRDEDGSLKIVNVTTPVGVIPESAKVWFDDYEENDGTIHEYLYAEVLLWKRQEAYQKIKKDGITAHSMEIKVKDGKLVDGIYYVEDFEFNAFALIGVTPCFESSELEVFSKNVFSQKMSEMMQDLKETFSMVNPYKKDDNIHPQIKSTEGGKGVLDEKKMKLAAKYGIDVNTLDFSIEELSLEELAKKFESMKKQPDDNTPKNNFALTSNMIDEIIRVLSADKITRDWGECPRYCYVDCDIDVGEVYCWDRNDWLLYGFKFTVDGDSIIIDFESKKRKKYVIADFEGGEQSSPIAPVFELIEDKLKDYSEVMTKFSEATNTIAAMTSELNELRQFKKDTEDAIAETKIEEVLSKFEDLSGVEAFETLKEHSKEYDLETLEEKCFAIRGRNNSASMKFSVKDKNPKIVVPKTDVSNEPYGGLFVKYSN